MIGKGGMKRYACWVTGTGDLKENKEWMPLSHYNWFWFILTNVFNHWWKLSREYQPTLAQIDNPWLHELIPCFDLVTSTFLLTHFYTCQNKIDKYVGRNSWLKHKYFLKRSI